MNELNEHPETNVGGNGSKLAETHQQLHKPTRQKIAPLNGIGILDVDVPYQVAVVKPS